MRCANDREKLGLKTPQRGVGRDGMAAGIGESV